MAQMTDKDYDKFFDMLAELMEMFQRTGDRKQLAHEISLYFDVLKADFNIDDIRDCVAVIIRQNTYYPKIADFYKAFDHVREDRYQRYLGELSMESSRRYQESLHPSEENTKKLVEIAKKGEKLLADLSSGKITRDEALNTIAKWEKEHK